MQITKIKFQGTKTEVRYAEEVLDTATETVVKCEHERHPAFTDVVNELVSPLIDMLSLPNVWHMDGDVAVSEIAFSYTEAGWGAKIKMQRILENFKEPLELKTPYIFEPIYKELGDILAKIEGHARDFVAGKRAQGDMISEFTETLAKNNVKISAVEIKE